MDSFRKTPRTLSGSAAILLLVSLPVFGQEPHAGKRWEATLNFQNWASLSDLQPVTSGSFDSFGFGLSGALHWPVKQFEHSELLVGFDAGIAAADSSIRGVASDLIARRAFITPSLKWMFGRDRRFSLDAGIGWHLLDIAETDSGYGATGLEVEYWQNTDIAPFFGATWDFKAGSAGISPVFSMGLKVHFVDFGVVRDENFYAPPTLGPASGDLKGPLIMLQFGAASR